MVKRVEVAQVNLWGSRVGAVAWQGERDCGVFEFDKHFLEKGWDISPLHMGLTAARRGDGVFQFPSLNKATFLGLPGLLADTLPDKFGNAIIDAWLARQGRTGNDFSPIERLCYTGKRGMGALEFIPASVGKYDKSVPVEIADLVDLAQRVISDRLPMVTQLGASEHENTEAILDILRVGTSAGGARPKAVIALNALGEVRSGQAEAPKGYDYWIVKFDGVTDIELGKPQGYGRIEYAYHLMALAAGITMTDCRLLEEQGRAHFMTKRFDRVGGKKRHMQSLCGLAHYDFNAAGSYSYEQAFEVMRKLRLSKAEAGQLFRRMVFNVVARNQDDHTKNISFLMDPEGKWRLSPAYDVMYSHNPSGRWTNLHQMSVNGKRDHFEMADLLAVARAIKLTKAQETIDEVIDAVAHWPEFAKQAGVVSPTVDALAATHRLTLAA